MDNQPDLIPICKVSEIGDGGKEVRLDTADGPRWLMLFLQDGRLSAWRNVCPHQGRALNWAPDKFLFSDEGLLVCCHHGASFELESGQCVAGPCIGAQLTPIAVKVEDDCVYLEKDQKD